MPRRRFCRISYFVARYWLYLGGFSTPWARFRGLFRSTVIRSCPGDNTRAISPVPWLSTFLRTFGRQLHAKEITPRRKLPREFECTSRVFSTCWARFWGLVRCTVTRSRPGDNVQDATVSLFWLYLGVFRPTYHVTEDCFDGHWYAQKITPMTKRSRSFYCTWIWVYLRVFHLLSRFLRISREVECTWGTRWVRFWGLFRWTCGTQMPRR